MRRLSAIEGNLALARKQTSRVTMLEVVVAPISDLDSRLPDCRDPTQINT